MACATTDVEPAQSQPVKDVWIDARLETAYLFNRHLNNFRILSDVDNGAVLLTGTVQSDIDKDLAEEIARSIDGVGSVNNQLVVTENIEATVADDPGREFGQKVDDATTTAQVKSQLLANSNLHGLQINVDTRYSVVTLAGEVSSHEQKQLAGYIAGNTPDVASVSNELEIVVTAKAPKT
jgi:osmotically-inducible protein OsmY